MVWPPGALVTHRLAGVRVGVSDTTADIAPDHYDVLLTDEDDPPRPWVRGSIDELRRAVDASPAAAATLTQVLRTTERLDVPDALAVESMGYSMLQHGEVFQAWLRERTPPLARSTGGEPVVVERSGDRLTIVLRRPEVHNALNAAMRDGLIEAFEIVDADPAITAVHLRGAGPSFCSGGDLSEFGTARDAAAAHLLRVERSVGQRVHNHAHLVTAHLHGSCVGAGIEISAFAAHVTAAPDTTIRLPEVEMGLIPGAGGTVSLPRRIGRHRTAYLALTGRPLEVATAVRWGLVDAVEAAEVTSPHE
jgi:enoyl-CoA hydratase/carnithine racemase